MTISSVSHAAQSYLSQLYSAQQTQAATDVFVAPSTASGTSSFLGAASADASNSLTGTASSNLDSQTLLGVMNLTQQDQTSTDLSQQIGQPGQIQSSQTQGTGHRHHHHGGGGVQQTTDVSSASATSITGSDASNPTATGATDSDDTNASLESALLIA